MSSEKDHARAVRYRRLAMAEADKEKSGLLNRIADEAERRILCTVDRMDRRLPPSSVPIN
jgi:hypothetical protein